MSAPSGADFGKPYRPAGGTRYGANKTKGIPAVGVGKSSMFIGWKLSKNVPVVYGRPISNAAIHTIQSNTYADLNASIILRCVTSKVSTIKAASASTSSFLHVSVPVTYAWRDELERKTHGAITRALGQDQTSLSRAGMGSRSASRHSERQFDHLRDERVREILQQMFDLLTTENTDNSFKL